MSTGAERRIPWRNPSVLVATGFCSGRFPAMPGTIGTLWAIPAFYAMEAGGIERIAQIALAILLAVLCVPISAAAERAIGTKDPPSVVCDEYAAYLLVLVCSPSGAGYWIGSFVLFRAFDIAKPWPLKLAQDRLPGGIGIMADDLLAALYTVPIVWAAAWIAGMP